MASSREVLTCSAGWVASCEENLASENSYLSTINAPNVLVWPPMRALLLCAVVVLGCSSEESKSDPGSGGTSGCQYDSAAAVRGCVDQAAITSDIQFVAEARPPGSPHWQAVQSLCKERFEKYGFTVTLDTYATGVNVIGIRQGITKPSERVLVSAHYDHLPGCAGADDNASGVVSLLETARVLSGATFAKTLVLACWDEEEDGLIGSTAYAAEAKAAGDDIVLMVSLEMLGFKSTAPNSQSVPAGLDILFPQQYADLEQAGFVGDFLTIIPDTSARASADRVAANASEIALPTVLLEITEALKKNPVISDVRRSDHAAFWDQDFPAMMLTDTSEFRNPNYHCRNGTSDTVDTLDLEFLTNNTRAMAGATADLVELQP